MKRLTLMLAAIGLSATSLHAAAELNVSVPQLKGGLTVGIQGIYAEPGISNGDLDYATVVVPMNTTSAHPSATTETKSVEPDFDWGYGASIGYVFPNTGNDVNVSYWHLNANSKVSANAIGEVVSLASFTPAIFNQSDKVNGVASANFHLNLNQVDLTAGQYINLATYLHLHPFAGLRYVDVKRDLNANATITRPTISATTVQSSITATSTPFNSNEVATETSDFSGIGPVVGVNIEYPLIGKLNLTSDFSGSLLITDLHAKLQQVYSVGARQVIRSNGIGNQILLPGASQFEFSANSNRIIPNLTAGMGLDYRYVFNNESDLTLGVNYQVAEYWRAIDSFEANTGFFNNLVSNPPAILRPVFTFGPVSHQTANLFVQGGVVSLTYHASPLV